MAEPGTVVRVILFYSRKSPKSMEMKELIDETGIDIDSVCVDPAEIRERILQDTKYSVREVPSVLVFFSTKRHKLYAKKPLDTWFSQLMANIKLQQAQDALLAQQIEAEETRRAAEYAIPSISLSERGISEKNAGHKYQRRMAPPGQRISQQMPTSEFSEETTSISEGDDESGDNPDLLSGMSTGGSIPHSVKKDGPNATELAKQMMQLRETIQDTEDSQRPFI